jgi:phosphoribosylformimino-5-aminoimidazole carboxamide ribotide isomerase
MKLIAVLDLMGGQVVHARRGMRNEYRPLVSRLCRSSIPLEVARALLRLHAFDGLYIADLDAIAGRESNRGHVAAIVRAFPQVELWLDAGIGDVAAYRELLAAGLGTPVLGSESMGDETLIAAIAARGDDIVLSLDSRAGRFLGPPALLDRPELWPRRVIAMNLDRVGAGAGPDFDLLRALAARRPGGEFFAAGGVRRRDDLEALDGAGVDGVLLASALHDGRLSAGDLDAVAPPVRRA